MIRFIQKIFKIEPIFIFTNLFWIIDIENVTLNSINKY